MIRSQKASRLRQRIGQQVEHLQRLAQVAQADGGMVRGSLYERSRRCGKQGCRCARGRLHRGMVVAVRANGRSRLVSVGRMDTEKLSELVGAYKRFRQARAEMVSTFEQLLETVDRLGKLREVGLKGGGLA